jgi:hypothetical protein
MALRRRWLVPMLVGHGAMMGDAKQKWLVKD